MLRWHETRRHDVEYMATILWSIGRLIGGSEYPMPSYDDFIHPKPVDSRNTGQIITGLIERLQQGGDDDGRSA